VSEKLVSLADDVVDPLTFHRGTRGVIAYFTGGLADQSETARLSPRVIGDICEGVGEKFSTPQSQKCSERRNCAMNALTPEFAHEISPMIDRVIERLSVATKD